MGRLIRTLFYLVLFVFVGLIIFAYLGPMFGADFSAPQSETRMPVTLDGS